MQEIIRYIVCAGFTDGIKSAATGLIDQFDFLWRGVCNGSDIIKDYVDLNNSFYSDIWTMAENGFNAFAAFGTGLLILFWFLGIVDKLTKDRLDGNALIRSGLEIIVGMGLMVNGYDILKAFTDIGNWFFLQTKNLGVNPNGTSDIVYPYQSFFGYDNPRDMAGLGFGDAFGRLFKYLGPVIVMLFIWIAVNAGYIFAVTVVMARAIQVMVYIVISPIPLADAFHNGIMNSSAIRFLKRFFALCLQGAMITLVLQTSSKFLEVATNRGLMITIATLFVSVSLVVKSQQITNDILDVH